MTVEFVVWVVGVERGGVVNVWVGWVYELVVGIGLAAG